MMMFYGLICLVSICVLIDTHPLEGPCAECALNGLDHAKVHQKEGVESFDVKEEEKEGPPREILPRDAEKQFHGVLMHGKDNTDETYEHTDEPPATENVADSGPQKPEDFFHGELMHGDTAPGKTHDHGTDGKTEEDVSGGLSGPEDPNEYFHGQLMHGDKEPGKQWEHEVKPELEKSESDGPEDPNEFFHGQMMHGDGKPGNRWEHEDEREDKGENSNSDGPEDPNKFFHGQLMHGDDEPGREYDMDHMLDLNLPIGQKEKDPSTRDLHGILMHGDNEVGVDHTDDHEKMPKARKFNLKSLMELQLSYDMLKLIDASNIMTEDLEEYRKWLDTKQQESIKAEDGQQNYWQNLRNSILLDDAGEDWDDRENDMMDDEFVERPGHAGPDRDEGMEHELELIGNTEPINARHKLYRDYIRGRQG